MGLGTRSVSYRRALCVFPLVLDAREWPITDPAASVPCSVPAEWLGMKLTSLGFAFFLPVSPDKQGRIGTSETPPPFF